MGYVQKDAEGTDIVEAIVSLRLGGAPISLSIARRLLTRVKSEPTSMTTRPAGASAASALTPREIEFLHLISRDCHYQDVADLLSSMVSSAQAYIKSMYRMLTVSSRSEALGHLGH